MILRTNADIDHAFSILSQAENLGCDTETSGLNPRNSRLFSVQFSDGDFSCLIPTSEGVPLGKLSQILENTEITKVFHNARFDLGFLGENGYEVNNVYCTMIAEKILTKGASQSASLAETLYRYFAVDLDKSQRDKFTKNWDKIWTEELVNYALADVIYLPELKRLQEEWLVKLGLSEEFGSKLDTIY
jgi:ribonuclease D